jgi:hypothetical protein
MALTKIVDCSLYAGLTQNAQACYEFKQWLKDNNVEFQLLMYSDDNQHQGVFDSLNTWWPDPQFSSFPIFIYTEIHDDLSPMMYPRKYFKTVADIQASDFLTQYAVGR